MFEDDYDNAIRELFEKKFKEYDVYLDFIEEKLGIDAIKSNINNIIKSIDHIPSKESIVEYKKGATNKYWMINRCNERYLVDNNLI